MSQECTIPNLNLKLDNVINVVMKFTMDRQRVHLQLYIIIWLWVPATISLLTFQAGRFNAARGKPTQQSSAYFSSSRAVDGNDGSSIDTCTHTQPTYHTWWGVNLQAVYTVYSVSLTNRDSNEYRLSNFTIYASNSNINPTQATDLLTCKSQATNMAKSQTKTFSCGNTPIRAQYIIVSKYHTSDQWQSLTLCEVQVEAECAAYTYGQGCNRTCSMNCLESDVCHHVNGSCPRQCDLGYKDDLCDKSCEVGWYGANCLVKCSPYCIGGVCNAQTDNGDCGGNCRAGYSGANCRISHVAAIVCGAMIFLILITLVVFGLLYLLRTGKLPKGIPWKKRPSKNQSNGGLENNGIEMDVLVVDGPSDTGIPADDMSGYMDSRLEEDEEWQKTEYQVIPFVAHSCNTGKLPENMVKNRYKNILAYDKTRVKLEKIPDDLFSDYINANFVKDYQGAEAYITASAPVPKCYHDFWRMIWEQEVLLIVMVTQLEEENKRKADQYWPTLEGVLQYGDISVSYDDEEQLSHFTIRTFTVMKNGLPNRTVMQYQYTVWPDKSVPENLSGLYKIRQVMKTYRTEKKIPMIIHCSAGVGRTGTIIAMDILLDQAEEEGEIDIRQCVVKLRDQRTHMVQTLSQYIFLHDAMKELLSVGTTCIPCSELNSLLNTDTGRANIMKQFELLDDYFLDYEDDDEKHVATSIRNRDKNRDLDIIPADNALVEIRSTPEAYINAVYVEGYDLNTEYITTQVPLPNTKEEFWKLIYEERLENIVCLQNDKKNEPWFPAEISGHIDTGSLKVTSTNQCEDTLMTIHTIKVDEQADDSVDANDKQNEHEVRLFEIHNWSNEDASLLMQVISDVQQKQKNKSADDDEDMSVTPIICLNGAKYCGVFIALSWLLKMAIQEEEVDVYHVVKEIKKSRPQFVESLEEYTILYTVIQSQLQ